MVPTVPFRDRSRLEDAGGPSSCSAYRDRVYPSRPWNGSDNGRTPGKQQGRVWEGKQVDGMQILRMVGGTPEYGRNAQKSQWLMGKPIFLVSRCTEENVMGGSERELIYCYQERALFFVALVDYWVDCHGPKIKTCSLCERNECVSVIGDTHVRRSLLRWFLRFLFEFLY